MQGAPSGTAPGASSLRRSQALALASILGVLLLLALLAGPRGGALEGDARPTSYRSGPEGTRALAMLLQELDIPTARLREPWSPELEAGILVVFSPTLPVDPDRTRDLREWVEGGGTLVLAVEPDHPLARGLGVSGALRGQRDPAVEDPDDAPPPSAPLTLPLGEGRVVAWPGVDPLRNGALREDASPARAFVAAVQGEVTPDRPVLFDEYVHGFRGDGSPAQALGTLLTTTAWGQWALQGGVAVLLLLLAHGIRFGAPLPPPPPPLRTSLEHAEALAAVYRKAGALDTARRTLLAGLSRRLGVRLQPGGPGSGASAGGETELHLPPGIRELPSAPALEAAWQTPGEDGLLALARAADALLAERRTPGRGRASTP